MKQKLISCLSVCSLIFLALLNVADAGSLEPVLRKALQSHSLNDELPVVIHLSDTVKTGSIRDKDKSIQRSKIIRALREKADVTQRDLRSFLKVKNAKTIKNLWIVNGIAVTVPARLITELASFPGVNSITLDYTINPPSTAYGTAVLPEWNLNAIKTPDVWNLGYTGNGVVVANMDTGVDVSHPDLQNKWRGGSNSWYDPNGEHTTPADANGHGTWTMGVLVGGAAGGTAIGVVPDAKWIAVKIFNDAGVATLSRIHQGFQWLLDPDGNPATDDAPDVVNASWELSNTIGKCVLDFQPDIQNLRSAGIAVIFAAGNSGPSTNTEGSPANNNGSFAAGAVDNNSSVASFSSRGPSACDGNIFPHVVAPGVNIKTTDLTGGGVFPYSYAYVSGTSFAAPHVAGTIALLLSAFPWHTVSEVELALKQSAADLGIPGGDNDYGYGLVDALAAYNLLNTTPVPILDVFPSSYGFGNLELMGNSSPRTFTITSQGTADLVTGTLSLAGQNASEFKLTNNTCSGKTLIPQSSCTVDVLFTGISGSKKRCPFDTIK